MIESLKNFAGLVWSWSETNFNAIAGWASIVGLIITLVTLWRVQTLKKALLDQAVKAPQHKLFEHVRTSLASKPRLTTSHISDINSLLKQVTDRNCSSIPFRTCAIKQKVKQIKQDVENKTKPDVIAIKLDELRILIGNPNGSP